MQLSDEWFKNSECIRKCRDEACVDDLCAAITKGSCHQIKEYVRIYCPTAVLRYDSLGRTPLHIAASFGKVDILLWLITTFNCDLDLKDKESGWTALHRAVFHGRLACAVLLIEHGANMWIRDREGLTPLDIATKDCAPWVSHLVFSRHTYEMPSALSPADPSELYTWGVNENFTLGHRNPKSCKLPETVDYFTKWRIHVKQVVMCKFHTVFVTVSGSAYACGHGEGGRLGSGHQEACLEPNLMVMGSGVCITMAAAGINHTVLVTDNGQLFACGLNKHCVLGIPAQPDRELIPVRVYGPLKPQRVVGCAAGMFHTVAWTDSGALYSWGTNGGQLGHPKGDLYVNQPRQVSGVYKEGDRIVCVDACDSATVIATKQGTVYLLHNYTCRRIISKQLDIEKVQIGGGRLDPGAVLQVDRRLLTAQKQLKEDSLRILIHKKSGDMIAWNKANGTLDRCRYDLPQTFLFKDITLCNSGISALLITNTGQAYLAKFGSYRPPKPARRSSQASATASNCYDSCLDMFDSDATQELILEQVSCVFRGHTGALGPKAKGGAVLQCEPRNFLFEVPVVSDSTLHSDIRTLWHDASDTDAIHDLIITVIDARGARVASIVCHNYVLASRSEYMRKILIEQSEKGHTERISDFENGEAINGLESKTVSELFVESCDINVLKNVIEFAYHGKCHVLTDGYKLPPLANYSNCSNATFSFTENFHEYSVDKEKPSHINGDESAFSVYHSSKKISNVKKTKKKSNSLSETPRKNFLSEFKVLMKRFGFHRSNLLDSVTSLAGTVHLKNVPHKTNLCAFDHHKFRDLCDIKLECLDGVILEAHKCILVARVEFFRSMLLSPWAESTKSVQTKVPIPSDVFKHVLEYVYADSDTVLSRLPVEMLCEVMAAADQLLLDRLKEIAEVQVAALLTLKNLSSILEFAEAFNCDQLLATCKQFVVHHLPALLNDPHFYSIDHETLKNLEEPYRANIAGVYRRVTTPYSSGPDISMLPVTPVNEEKGFSFDQASPTEIAAETFSLSPQKKRSTLGKKGKKKTLSKAGSLGGVTLSELLTRREKNVDVLVERIAASSIKDQAMHGKMNLSSDEKVEEREIPTEKVEREIPREMTFDENKNVTNKTKVTEHAATQCKDESRQVTQNIISPKSAVSFKDIMAAEEARVSAKVTAKRSNPTLWGTPTPTPSHNPLQHSPMEGSASAWGSARVTQTVPTKFTHGGSGSIALNSRPKKLSQKQRKKMESELLKQKSEEAETAAPLASSPPPNAWGALCSSPPSSKSFWDVMKEQSFSPEPGMQATRAKSPTKTCPKSDSPWQQAPTQEQNKMTPTAVSPRTRSNSSFRDIMQNELQHTERTQKQKNKAMHLIQTEDRAMTELKAHYERTAPPIDGQFFTVERIPDYFH